MPSLSLRLLLAALLSPSIDGARPARAPLERPNVVLFFVDDLGYGDVGFNGHPTTSTAAIDRLAFGGKVLTTWYSACPVCSCSRASLLTGRQWARMGIPGVFGPTQASGLPLNETTLADQLRGAGYATAAVGKWHLGQRAAYLPAARGFDRYLGIPYSDDMGEARATPCERASGMSDRPGGAPRARGSTEGGRGGRGGEGRAQGVVDESLRPYVDAGLAPPPSLAEADDPAGKFLPLLLQNRSASGEVVTSVLEQPTDLNGLGGKYEAFALDFLTEHAARPFFLYLPFSHVHTTANNQPEQQCGGEA